MLGGYSKLIRKLRNVLPRYPELVSDVLVSEPWIIEHRTQPDECSFAMELVKPLLKAMCCHALRCTAVLSERREHFKFNFLTGAVFVVSGLAFRKTQETAYRRKR
jgi:hypothetical protein